MNWWLTGGYFLLFVGAVIFPLFLHGFFRGEKKGDTDEVIAGLLGSIVALGVSVWTFSKAGIHGNDGVMAGIAVLAVMAILIISLFIGLGIVIYKAFQKHDVWGYLKRRLIIAVIVSVSVTVVSSILGIDRGETIFSMALGGLGFLASTILG